MADEKLVRILREEGVEAWNSFVRQQGDGWRADLDRANLDGADLSGANLSGANLETAYIYYAKLDRANLSGANLSRSYLDGASLIRANLSHALLDHTHLIKANLRSAILHKAILNGVLLHGANLLLAKVGDTGFSNIGLSTVSGLESIEHQGPSSIDQRTLSKSRGGISNVFLEGCGFQEWEVAAARLYDPDLTSNQYIDISYRVAELRAIAPIQRNPVFICYSHADSLFVDKLQAAFGERGVRTWRDIHSAEAGPLEKVIDRAISLNPTMVLVLSAASCKSDWVAWEIEKARNLEKEQERSVLCPVPLDDAWRTKLPAPERKAVERYAVIDLSGADAIERQMPRILKGLDIHYRSS